MNLFRLLRLLGKLAVVPVAILSAILLFLSLSCLNGLTTQRDSKEATWTEKN